MKNKKIAMISGLALMVLLFFVSMSSAVDIDVGGRYPLQLSGYISQSVTYGLEDGYYDNQHGFNSFITQALVEASYQPSNKMRLFLSGNLNMDQAYTILDGDSEWEAKGFDKSDDHQHIYDDSQDLLKEAHVSWASGDFFFRIGKQVVQWGETDGLRLTNLINPVDQRRGPSDVRFESTIIPIWMLRAEYNTAVDSTAIQNFGVQFIFDPAADFRGNEVMTPGNEYQGVWSPYVEAGPFAYIGSLDYTVEEPDSFDSDYFSYGLRLTAETHGANIALMGFLGKDRDYAALPAPPFIYPDPLANDYDGKMILHPVGVGKYYDFTFVGLTFSREVGFLKANFLGGVAPVIRMETLYAFDTTYSATDGMFFNELWETDEFRSMVGFDWKFKCNPLNPRAFFMLSGQYFYQKIMDYPDAPVTLNQRGSVPGPLEEDNNKVTLLLNTNYLHNKLQPNIFWAHDITNDSDFVKIWLNYEYTHNWIFSLGSLFMSGDEVGNGDEPLDHKDQVYGTITYRF